MTDHEMILSILFYSVFQMVAAWTILNRQEKQTSALIAEMQRLATLLKEQK